MRGEDSSVTVECVIEVRTGVCERGEDSSV